VLGTFALSALCAPLCGIQYLTTVEHLGALLLVGSLLLREIRQKLGDLRYALF